MKIERKENNFVEFGSLKEGNVFEYNDTVFIKTEELGCGANSVNLEYGERGWFGGMLLVKSYPNAKLVLED